MIVAYFLHLYMGLWRALTAFPTLLTIGYAPVHDLPKPGVPVFNLTNLDTAVNASDIVVVAAEPPSMSLHVNDPAPLMRKPPATPLEVFAPSPLTMDALVSIPRTAEDVIARWTPMLDTADPPATTGVVLYSENVLAVALQAGSCPAPEATSPPVVSKVPRVRFARPSLALDAYAEPSTCSAVVYKTFTTGVSVSAVAKDDLSAVDPTEFTTTLVHAPMPPTTELVNAPASTNVVVYKPPTHAADKGSLLIDFTDSNKMPALVLKTPAAMITLPACLANLMHSDELVMLTAPSSEDVCAIHRTIEPKLDGIPWFSVAILVLVLCVWHWKRVVSLGNGVSLTSGTASPGLVVMAHTGGPSSVGASDQISICYSGNTEIDGDPSSYPADNSLIQDQAPAEDSSANAQSDSGRRVFSFGGNVFDSEASSTGVSGVVTASKRADVSSVAIRAPAMPTTVPSDVVSTSTEYTRGPAHPITPATHSTLDIPIAFPDGFVSGPLSPRTSDPSALPSAVPDLSELAGTLPEVTSVNPSCILPPEDDGGLVDTDVDSDSEYDTSAVSQATDVTGPPVLPVDDNGCLIVSDITKEIAAAFGLPEPPKKRKTSRGGKRRTAQIKRQNAEDLQNYQELLAASGVALPPFPAPCEASPPASPQPLLLLPTRTDDHPQSHPPRSAPPQVPQPPQHASMAAEGIVAWQHRVLQEHAGGGPGRRSPAGRCGSMWAGAHESDRGWGTRGWPEGGARARDGLQDVAASRWAPRGTVTSRWAPRPAGWGGERLSPPRRPARERV